MRAHKDSITQQLASIAAVVKFMKGKAVDAKDVGAFNPEIEKLADANVSLGPLTKEYIATANACVALDQSLFDALTYVVSNAEIPHALSAYFDSSARAFVDLQERLFGAQSHSMRFALTAVL